MISVILVDYKSIDRTIEYIKHLLCFLEIQGRIHFLVIDNYSDSQALNKLTRVFGEYNAVSDYNKRPIYLFSDSRFDVIYFDPGENGGYAKGNNVGVHISEKLYNDSYYVISNNDLRLTEKLNWTNVENIFKNDNKIAVVGPRVIGLDGKDQSPHKRPSYFDVLIAPYIIHFGIIPYKADISYDGNNKKCYRVMGSFLIMRPDYFRKVDYFDEKTFLFGEELILGEKLKSVGLTMFFWNDYKIIHEHGAVIGKNQAKLVSDKISFSSCLYYFKRYRKLPKLIEYISKVNFNLYLIRVKIKILLKGSNK